MTLAVETRKLTKKFGPTVVLNQINFSVPKGKICGIIGKSGTGKTTLLRCLNGLESPDEGMLLLEGEELTKKSPARQRILSKIGSIFQNLNLLSRRTVLDNVLLPIDLLRQRTPQDREKALSLLEMVGIADKVDQYPSQLSGGQQQRVAIARALAFDATLLLCDEFTSALDPETILDILQLIRDLNQRLGITVVLITHDMSVIREICDHVTVLEGGSIVESGSIESILLAPQHPVTQAFVAHLFVKDLPHWLQETLMASPPPHPLSSDQPVCDILLRLTFAGEAAREPIIASLVTRFGVAANIIAGNLDHIRQQAFGTLVLSFPYTPLQSEEILTFLKTAKVAPEVLGYCAKLSEIPPIAIPPTETPGPG